MKKSNLKQITYISVIFMILLLFLTGFSIGKSYSEYTIKGKGIIAEPIIEVLKGEKINITDENKQGKYIFTVRNYNGNGKITDTKINYTITIEDTIDKNLKDTIKFELYKNEKKVELKEQKTGLMELNNKSMQEDKYELKIEYNKDASTYMQDIIEEIQIQVHSEQAKA